MTHREYILKTLKIGPMSCTQIANYMLIEKFFPDSGNYSRAKRNLTSTLSGTLNRMIKNGELAYAGITPLKGAIYKLR